MDYPGKVISKNAVVPSQTSASGVWTLDDAAAAVESNTWPIAGVPNPISRSLRFNSADSAYLNRTPATAGNRRTWVFSAWVKRSALGANERFFTVDGGASRDTIIFNATTDTLSFWFADASAGVFTTNRVFRDVGAWYHLVFAIDTTQATNTDRFRFYVNGEKQTFSSVTYPSLDYQGFINNNVVHNIGRFTSGIQYFNGYATEIHLIDGYPTGITQGTWASSFGDTCPILGEFNSTTGVWQPKKYTGTYGTNGFYLNFSDNASTAALGTDYSGNNNTWTTNNFSVTAGAGNDSLTDVPTPWWPYNTTGDVGGVVRGNYATLNPLNLPRGGTLSNGNLDWATPTAEGQCVATMYVSSGKWYWEMIENTAGGCAFGIASITTDINNANLTAGSYVYHSNGNKYNGGSGSAYGATFTNGNVIGVALDLDAGTLVFYKDGTSQGTAFTGLSGTFTALIYDGTSASAPTFTANFGQRSFAYTPPAGFLSLCTTNLPTPTILDGTDYFNTVLYTGNGATGQTITGVGFQPDWVWVKGRSVATDHYIADVVRGATKYLQSNTTAAEGTNNGITAFTSDGFSVGAIGDTNTNAQTFVAWNWKANGAGSTNTAGTITSTVSVNTTSGFSIVTYTSNNTAGATIGHGLGVAPSLVICRERDTTASWAVYHASVGGTGWLRLNSTGATTTSSLQFNSTAPTSTVVTLGGAGSDTNDSVGLLGLAYCFAAIPGYSAFGSYTGNGSADGPFVYTGFRPRYIVIKRSSGVEDWRVFDTARSTYNIQGATLYPNTSSAENSSQLLDINSNGFKCRTTDVAVNGSGSTYIYFSFAENPFKYSNAR